MGGIATSKRLLPHQRRPRRDCVGLSRYVDLHLCAGCFFGRDGEYGAYQWLSIP